MILCIIIKTQSSVQNCHEVNQSWTIPISLAIVSRVGIPIASYCRIRSRCCCDLAVALTRPLRGDPKASGSWLLAFDSRINFRLAAWLSKALSREILMVQFFNWLERGLGVARACLRWLHTIDSNSSRSLVIYKGRSTLVPIVPKIMARWRQIFLRKISSKWKEFCSV